MGLVGIYLPINMNGWFLYGVHVGKYTSSSHGWYGFGAAQFVKNKGDVFLQARRLYRLESSGTTPKRWISKGPW